MACVTESETIASPYDAGHSAASIAGAGRSAATCATRRAGAAIAGGLIVVAPPVGFALMALQGVSEIIKRIAALENHYRLQYQYEKPLQ